MSFIRPEAGPLSNQFALLKQKRFAPFFWTAFLGAFNDNAFKFAFTILVTYRLQVGWLPPALAGLVIGALFILPFLLFSATSGQLSDKYDKAKLMRWVKNLEVVIMLIAAYGFIFSNIFVLLLCVLLMGTHSALFGPVKFSYLPQVLNEGELTGGNGMVAMGTFVAILLGNITGALLVADPVSGSVLAAVVCTAIAIFGRIAAHFVPASPPNDTCVVVRWNPIAETWRNLRLARGDQVVFRSLLGISWMWFYGAVFLSQFPSFAKEVLHGDAQVASLLLVIFSVGIGIGSLLCEKLSKGQVEIGLVPIGAVGMTVFACELYFATYDLPITTMTSVVQFISVASHWRVMLDLGFLSLFVGLYSVPMYAFIQLRSPVTHRARIIAANNILNALFMIISAVMVGALLKYGATIPEVFLMLAIGNALITAWFFATTPSYLHRFFALTKRW